MLEVKGQDTQQDKAKRSFLNEWCKAVNAHGGFGVWEWDVSFNPMDIAEMLREHSLPALADIQRIAILARDYVREQFHSEGLGEIARDLAVLTDTGTTPEWTLPVIGEYARKKRMDWEYVLAVLEKLAYGMPRYWEKVFVAAGEQQEQIPAEEVLRRLRESILGGEDSKQSWRAWASTVRVVWRIRTKSHEMS